MKIICNALIINDKPTGLGVYSINVLKRLSKRKIIDNIIFSENKFIGEICDKNQNYTKYNFNKGKIGNILLRNLIIKKNIDKSDKDLLLYSTTVHGSVGGRNKQVITIHDLMPIYYPNGRLHQTFYYKYILPLMIRKSNKIIAVSQNTKRDIIKMYGVNPDKIEVVYNGVDKVKILKKEEINKLVKEELGMNYKYFLMVGIHYKYKNLEKVIKAFNEIKDITQNNLVIVGNYNCGYGNELLNLVNELKIEDRVKFLGYVDEKYKNAIYQGSEGFIYPSLYEGFGLPVLEAMANQCVVACSNTSSLPEVGKDAVIYFNPESVEEIKESIIRMLNLKEEEKQQLVANGNENVEFFNWDKCVERIEDILRDVSNN